MRKERKRKTKKAKPKTSKVIGKRHTGCLRHVPYRIFLEDWQLTETVSAVRSRVQRMLWR